MNPKNANEAIQGKINRVLDEPALKNSNPMRQGQHPEVDYSKLTAKQRAEANSWISEIKQLQKQYHLLKRQAHNCGDYERQRKNADSLEFYDECLKACSREIIKIHETN